MTRLLQPVAVAYSPDGGEYWVSPRYAGRYRVFGPWTADAIVSFKSAAKAVAWMRAWAAAS
ncbi:MAG: hypothetical protein WBY94_19510 [Polyangiaceae bacterium]